MKGALDKCDSRFGQKVGYAAGKITCKNEWLYVVFWDNINCRGDSVDTYDYRIGDCIPNNLKE